MTDTELLPFQPMADGALTSSLAKDEAGYFFGTQALPETRGHVLTLILGRWLINQEHNSAMTDEMDKT
jgi:hypothetical protein